MPEPILQTKALDAFYGDFQALFGVSVSLMPGEVVAIIGANGAGKTTLLRSICGLIKNRPETVWHRQEKIGELSADRIAKRGIAMVPEGRQLFRSLSVEENLVIGGQVGRSGPWTIDRVFELFPVLAERRNQRATDLSGGQQQMVAIGRALMANPEIILFDEISLGLAPIIIKSIYDSLPSIVGEGLSAIIVEQDITKALSVSNRVYCLQEGKISLEGTTGEVSRQQISQAYFGV